MGKLDATSDLGHGVLRVEAVHWDVDPGRAMRTGLDREISSLAAVVGVDVDRRD